MPNARNSETVRSWLQRIKRAGKREEEWRERAKKVVEKFRDERDMRGDAQFNILWANTETLKPALYSARPKPDIRRRWRQPDPVSGAVALMLERSAEFFMDTQPFDATMHRVVEDYLLTGRAVARVRYEPTFFQPEPVRVPLMRLDDGAFVDPNGQPREPEDPDAEVPVAIVEQDEELENETVAVEYVPWKSLRLGPGKTWQDIDWIAFHHQMDRDELVENFGARGRDVHLESSKEDDRESSDENDEAMKVADVWEVWDKAEREVLFVADGLPDRPLELKDDPLGLRDFYPCPEPLYSVRTNDSMIPIPEFTLYQDQADELDEITARINHLMSALKVRGAYDASAENIGHIISGDDNELIPVENWRALVDKGGLDGVISWLPVDQIAKVVVNLYAQRDQLLQTIFQITGLSDIQRGSTDPRETKGAQQLKAQFSSLRLRPRQEAVQAFTRDIVRLMAEIVAENFSPQTLQQMTGIPIAPEMMEMMQSDEMRGFAIDVETDSTVASDVEADREQTTAFLSTLVESVNAFAPLVQSGIMPLEAAKQIILFAARKFKVSRELEQALDSLGQQAQQPEPDPKEQAEAIKAQVEQQKLQQQAQQQQFEQQLETFKARLEATELELEQRKQEHAERMDLLKATQEAADAA